MINEIFREKVGTNREKAIAAGKLGDALMSLGGDRDLCIEMAVHELKHALAHKGESYIGAEENGFWVTAYYHVEGELTKEQKRKIALAVGKENMSTTDRRHAR